MSNTKTLMKKYGQLGFNPDMEGFIKLFNNTYIREIFIKVYNGDDVLVNYNRKNLIAECVTGYDQKKRLVLKEIKTIDYQPILMNVAVDNISECLGFQRGRVKEYFFNYNNITYSLDIIPYSDKFEPALFTDENGQVVTSISTQNLIEQWGSCGFKEMTPQEFYNVFTIDGVHVPVADIWVTDHSLKLGRKLKQESTLLKNKIKNVFLRHEINEDGTENIIIHKGGAKGKGGYNSDFIIVVPCDKISGCIYKDAPLFMKDGSKTIQFAFDNIICLLEYKQEVK